ncbi:MAG: Gfo/Idh/MocA family oxidoreductase, partial [Agathobacter sp.]|nr:Gfo/Idh/MocA family oxidoreductase [Agathobacter sp.]
MQEIRLGTIGSGFIMHHILDAVKQVEGIRCVAVYSRTEEKGQELAQKYEVEKIYTDMEDFLADEEINCVYVASPNLLHYEQTKKALLAGKHVLCEKPFCTKLEDAKELVSLAKEKGLFLMEAVPTTYLANYPVLKEAIAKIGRIKLVQGNFSQYSSRYDAFLRGELPNVFNPEFAGGCLMDINFYNVYLNVALFG